MGGDGWGITGGNERLLRGGIQKTYIFEPESFKPLAVVQNGETYHYHLDHLGTPKELTRNSGELVWKARYKTYGNLAVKEVEEVENNLRFQGQYFDAETGLHYNRHRYYDPSLGQFISQDPIGLLGGVNNYQYAPNPTGWVDPLGLSCKEIKYEKLKEMGAEYGGEEIGYAKAWSMFGNPEIKYLETEVERMPFLISVQDGKLTNALGDYIDTGDSANGKWMFVMDSQGQIFAGKQQVMSFHHSSFLAGQNVAAAGEIEVINGLLVSHSRKSGHYKPNVEHHEQFKSEMQERGINLGGILEDSIE